MRVVLFLALACTGRSAETAGVGDSAVAPDWSMAGCTSVSHNTYAGSPATTSTCLSTYLGSPDRPATSDCLSDDGPGYSTSASTWNAVGCLRRDQYESGTGPTDVYSRDQAWTCDDHGNPLTWASYDMTISDSGTATEAEFHSYSNAYDDDGHLVHREDSSEDFYAGNVLVIEDWTYTDGLLQTYTQTGEVYWDLYEVSYFYDDALRVVEERDEVTYSDGDVVVSRGATSWDDLDRLTGYRWDYEDDGAVESDVLYTYVEDSDWIATYTYNYYTSTDGEPYITGVSTYECP